MDGVRNAYSKRSFALRLETDSGKEIRLTINREIEKNLVALKIFEVLGSEIDRI
jgi:hypothetical protein